MDKFIKLLLETENTVILPGFGAVVIENENTGKLMFNEYLSYNDGKLAQIILDNSNMSEQEVQNYIAKHVREIQITLDKGDAYAIFELGEFSKDKEGKIEFNGNKNTGGAAESPSKDVKAPINDSKEEKQEPENQTKPENRKEKEEQKEKKAAEKPVENKTKETATVNSGKDSKTDTSTAASESEPKKENKYTPPIKEEKVVTDKTANTKSEHKKETTVITEKKKKSTLKYVLLILVIVIGAAATFIGIKYDEVKAYMGWDQFEEVEDLAQIQEDLKVEEPVEEETDPMSSEEGEEMEVEEIDTTITNGEDNSEVEENPQSTDVAVEEEVQPQEEEATPLPSSNNGEYHLIAGTFSEKANAEKFVAELKDSGLPAQMIGPYNNMHYVSASSFNSAETANQKAPELRQKGISVWTYKQPY